jgi:release factor glutamine methyltransferase
MPTAKELLAEGRAWLSAAGVAAPALDARLLLQHAANIATADLVARPEMIVSAPAAVTYQMLVERRALREPVSKIIGIKEFFGREFLVSSAVLDPRPDSESLIELCLKIIDTHGASQVLDLGTGSGNLLLTLLAERRHLTGLGIDLSQEALKVAFRNATALGLVSRCDFMLGRWFEPVAGRFDLIVSNPPYIETAVIDSLQPEVRLFDPRKALDGGPDGLDCYRAIAGGAASFLAPGGYVAVEIGDGQDAAVTQLFDKNGFESAGKRLDLAGKPRALAFRPV